VGPWLVDCPEPPLPLVPAPACTTRDPRETFAEFDPFRDNEQNGVTGIITWDMPFFADTPVSDLRLGFIGSWQQNIEDGAIDFDGTNIPEQLFDQRRNTKQQSFEAYLERLDVGMWDFRAGGYFYEEKIDSELCFDTGSQRPGQDIGYNADVDTQSVATYGEFGVRPFDNLRIFGGIRWTKDRKEADELIQGYTSLNRNDDITEKTLVPRGNCGRYFRDLLGVNDDPSVFDQPNPPLTCCTIIDENEYKNTRDEWQGVTPMGGLEWQMLETSTLGFTITRGFKAGGFPLAVSTDLESGTIKRYDSEFVMEYELTSKNELFDGRLRLNVTGFWMEYDPFQICQFNGPSFFCRSDGSATIRGIEVEWRANPIEGLQLNGHFNYLDSRINDFQIQDPTVRVCVQIQSNCPSLGFPPQPSLPAQTIDVSGNEQPKAPTYAGSFGIQYEFDTGRYGFFTPRFQSQFQGTTFYRVFNRDEFSEDDYIKFDAKLTWRSVNERYAIEIFGVNLTDEDVLNSLFVGSVFSGGQVLGQYQPPRTYGAKFSVNYVADWVEDLL
jgi:iron complex outermembrane receptor protein